MAGVSRDRGTLLWGAHAPSRAVVDASPTTFFPEQENFGEAPKLAREARALPRLQRLRRASP